MRLIVRIDELMTDDEERSDRWSRLVRLWASNTHISLVQSAHIPTAHLSHSYSQRVADEGDLTVLRLPDQ